jgi:hypothetical protein
LRNPVECAILAAHAGFIPEKGFSAPLTEQKWWLEIELGSIPPITHHLHCLSFLRLCTQADGFAENYELIETCALPRQL